MKSFTSLIPIPLMILFPACSQLNDSVESSMATNHRAAGHFGNFPIDDASGQWRASYFPSNSEGRQEDPPRGLGLIYPTGTQLEVASKSGFETSASDIVLTISDGNGTSQKSMPVRIGQVLLIEDNSKDPVVLEGSWVPSGRATKDEILVDFGKLVETRDVSMTRSAR